MCFCNFLLWTDVIFYAVVFYLINNPEKLTNRAGWDMGSNRTIVCREFSGLLYISGVSVISMLLKPPILRTLLRTTFVCATMGCNASEAVFALFSVHVVLSIDFCRRTNQYRRNA